MRIAIDARLIGGTGTGDSTYWTDLCLAMVQQNSGHTFLLMTDDLSRLPLELRDFGVLIQAAHSRAWSLFAFPRACRRFRADVAHVQYNVPPLMPCPVVTTIHDVSFFIGPEWFSPKDRFLLQRFIPRSTRRASAILTVSETSQMEIEKYLPGTKGKVHAILNGPNHLIHRISPGESTKAVQKLGITRPFLMTLGTLWPRKNMQLAVDAWLDLKKSRDIDLVVVGKQGTSIIAEHSGLHRTGYLDWHEISALYSSAQAYLCPSLHEGFGIPILEAWSCGCPVVTTNCGALPEVVGDAGLVIESLDPQIWARNIEELLSDSGKLEALRSLGFTRLGQFSWEKAAKETIAVYEKVFG